MTIIVEDVSAANDASSLHVPVFLQSYERPADASLNVGFEVQ